MLISAFAEALKKPRRDSGMRAHADADDAQLGDAALRDQLSRADFFHDGIEQFLCLLQIGFVNRE